MTDSDAVPPTPASPVDAAGLRWLWLPILGLAGLGLAALFVSMRIESSWRAAHEQAVRRVRATAAQTWVRPVLLDSSVPGDAWIAWREALSKVDVAALEPFDDVLATASPCPDPAALDAVIDAQRVILTLLIEGARHGSGRFPSDPAAQEEFTNDIRPILYLGRLAVTAAERRFERGDVDGALDLLLAGLQFARDLADGAPCLIAMIGSALITRIGPTVAHWMAREPFTDPARQRLAKALATLDTSWPDPLDVVVAEHDWMARTTGLHGDHPFGADELGVPRWALWRNAFSAQSAITDWWTTSLRLEDEFRIARALDWHSARARYSSTAAGLGDPLIRMLTPPLENADRTSREAHACVRVLREALAASAGGASLGSIDPFTHAPLRREEHDGRVRIWSLGADATDEGGLGWLVEPKNGGDLAIEVAR